jgi:choline monooxygenase
MWDELNREDLAILEKLQRGRRSPGYDGGRLSAHWESPTLQFAQHVLDATLEA